MNFKTIVFLFPGIFNRASVFFSPLTEVLKKAGISCVPLDLPGRDTVFKNPPPEGIGKVSLIDDCRFCTDIIKKKKAEDPDTKIVAIGHSRGGLLALMTAQKIIFDGIILLAPALPKGIAKIGFDPVRFIVFFSEWIKHPISWKKRPVKRSFFGTKFGVLDSQMSKTDAKNDHETLVWESGQVIWALGYNPPHIPFSTIKSPISIIGGAKDRLVPLNDLMRMKEFYEVDNKYFHIYNSAHYLFWGKEGKRVIAQIVEWITKI